MVATTVFVVGVVGLAPIFLLAARATAGARMTTYAAILAQAKMEQLRTEPEESAGGTALSPSPVDALARNTAGYSDFLDANGRSLGGGTLPPASTAFVRRWSIEPLPANPDRTLVLQVRVVRLRDGRADRLPGAPRFPDEARIVSLKTQRGTR